MPERGEELLEQGRAAFRNLEWRNAVAAFTAADEESPLGPDDLYLLGMAAYMSGLATESTDALARAYRALLEQGRLEKAARTAFWTGFGLMNRGEMSLAGGWMGRAAELVEQLDHECVVQGYLMMPAAIQAAESGDPSAALEICIRVTEIAQRYGDPDLLTMARLGRARSLIKLRDISSGSALLDEVMVATASGEVSHIVVGMVHCAAVLACQECFDVRRAHEWVSALHDWCELQPDLVPYRGQCLVHRSQIMQLRGAWAEALEEVQRAQERLSQPTVHPAVGMAHYQLGELHRLRGDLAAAEQAYGEGNRFGRRPQPGLALLRLAQGRVDAAKATIVRVLEESGDPAARSELLPAAVEILVAAEDVEAARAAAEELSRIAGEIEAPLIHALSARATGAVRLAEGDTRDASEALQRACAIWQDLEAPYEEARTRALIGLAYRALGDEDSARLELDAARAVFEQLGAAPDLARMDGGAAGTAGGLTRREVEVLRLISAGNTNRAIAEKLVISEKTVARHVSNIFTKLGLSSRAAATAYAYEHDLV